MNPIPVSCEGVSIASLAIPPFRLQTGTLVCLHMPGPACSEEEEQVIQALTGKRQVPGLYLFGRVAWARPARPLRVGLFGLFSQDRSDDWLVRAAGVSRAEAGAVLARLGLRPTWAIRHLPLTPTTLLGLEAAWAGGAEALVFLTAGLDPSGREAVYQSVAARLGQCAAIHLSYPFLQNGQKQRSCLPTAHCIEVKRQCASPTSLAAGKGRA
jgi:hypothetical protein